MKPLHSKPLPHRSALALAACSALLLGACGSTESMLSGDRIDYRSKSAKTAPLEVPPDLTQLARDGRYRPQNGVVSASGVAGAASASAGAAAPQVALASAGDMRIERLGNQRWLVTPMTPEQLWPQLQAFWPERGFTIEVQDAAAGVMETGWAENRAKLPQDMIRNTIGRVFDSLYSTGERDKFRTRIERTPAGTEVYITHRGLEEVYSDAQRSATVWQPRKPDPQLEAEFLSRLMIKLGAKPESAQAAVSSTPEKPVATLPALASGATTLDLDDNFDRAWRRVGLSLDRAGYTIEDRDRAAGLYFVRYVAPGSVGDEPGFLSKLFGGGGSAQAPARYRVAVKAAGNKTTVSVQNAQGAPESGDVAQRIIGRLANDLR